METRDLVDEYLDIALAETFSKPGAGDVTPADRAKLKGLLAYYAKKPHPFTACKRDQMKHGLPEEHANRRCAVIKDLIRGNTKWRGKGKTDLSEGELAEYRLDIPEEFVVWLTETPEEEMLREAEKEGVVFKLKALLGLGPDEEDDEENEEQQGEQNNPDEEYEDEEDAGDDSPDFEADDEPAGSPQDGDNEERNEESERLETPIALAYQLPYDLSEPEKISKKLWRKHILPLGKKVNYTRNGVSQVLNFSKETLEKMVENFHAGAFDKVYFTARHSRESEDSRGVVRDVFLGNDGLYADIEVSEDGEKLLANSLGEIGTSVSYDPNYIRQADGKAFGPSLQHIAAVPTPHVPGLRAWELIEMSEATEVVDLTDAQYSSSQTERGGPVETEVTENQEKEVEMENNQISLEEFNAMRDEVERNRKVIRNQAVARLIESRKTVQRDGKSYAVPKAHLDAAQVILNALEGTESDVIELSASGSATIKESEVGNAVSQLLSPPELVELGESGASDVDAQSDDPEERLQLAMDNIAKEHPELSADELWDRAIVQLEGVN